MRRENVVAGLRDVPVTRVGRDADDLAPPGRTQTETKPMAYWSMAGGANPLSQRPADDDDRLSVIRIMIVKVPPFDQRRADGLEIVRSHHLIIRLRQDPAVLDSGFEFEFVGNVPSNRSFQRTQQHGRRRS